MLGKEHPDTLASVNNLAGLLRKQGRYEEAEPLYRRALKGCEEVFGEEHPHTLATRDNLEQLLRKRRRSKDS